MSGKAEEILVHLNEHLEELRLEVEYAEKHKQVHGHQDIWIKFINDLIEGRNPKREEWSV